MIGPISRRLFLGMAAKAGLVVPAAATVAPAFGGIPLKSHGLALTPAAQVDRLMAELKAILDAYITSDSRWTAMVCSPAYEATRDEPLHNPYVRIERWDRVPANEPRCPKLMIEHKVDLHHPAWNVFLGAGPGKARQPIPALPLFSS